MIRNVLLTASLVAGVAMTVSAPAQADSRTPSCGRSCGSVPVPEPGMLGLMGAGIAAMAVVRHKKARRD